MLVRVRSECRKQRVRQRRAHDPVFERSADAHLVDRDPVARYRALERDEQPLAQIPKLQQSLHLTDQLQQPGVS